MFGFFPGETEKIDLSTFKIYAVPCRLRDGARPVPRHREFGHPGKSLSPALIFRAVFASPTASLPSGMTTFEDRLRNAIRQRRRTGVALTAARLSERYLDS